MAGLKILYNLILKDTVKRSGSASGILSIGKDVRKLADKKFQRYVKSAQNQGVDLDKLSEQEAKYMLELNKPKEPVVLSNEDAYAFLNRFLNQGKKGEVIKGKFNKPSVKEISFVDDVINDINKMETITAMKEVNRVIGKQGRYRDLTKKEIDRIFKETEDRTAGRLDDIEPEDFAYGGIAGMLGEPTFQDEEHRVPYKDGKTGFSGTFDEWRAQNPSRKELLSEVPSKNIGDFIGPIPQYDEKGNLIPIFSKTGKQQIEGAPEGITSDKEVFNLIVGLDIPITEKIKILGNIGFSKFRDKVEKGDKELGLYDKPGNVDKNISIGYEDDGLSGSFTYNPYTKHKQFQISKTFADGGVARQNFAMGRRAFMKLLGGAAAGIGALKTGAFKLLGKKAAPVAREVITTPAAAGKPAWFDALVTRVINEGDDVTKKFATKEREIVHLKKIDEDATVTVTRNLDEGTVRVDIDDVTTNVADEQGNAIVSMEVRGGQLEQGVKGKTPAEFEAVETDYGNYLDRAGEDYTTEAVENTVRNTKDLTADLTKVKMYAKGQKKPTIKEMMIQRERAKNLKLAEENPTEYASGRQPDIDYASGGIARMLGE
jgi:hypothetical protein